MQSVSRSQEVLDEEMCLRMKPQIPATAAKLHPTMVIQGGRKSAIDTEVVVTLT